MAHHKRNVYRDGIADAARQPHGPIVGRRLGRCWFAGCRGGCAGWKVAKVSNDGYSKGRQ